MRRSNERTTCVNCSGGGRLAPSVQNQSPEKLEKSSRDEVPRTVMKNFTEPVKSPWLPNERIFSFHVPCINIYSIWNIYANKFVFLVLMSK